MKTIFTLALSSLLLLGLPALANETQTTKAAAPLEAVQVADQEHGADAHADHADGDHAEHAEGDHGKMAGHKCDGSCGHKECKKGDGHSCGKSCNAKNCKHHKHHAEKKDKVKKS